MLLAMLAVLEWGDFVFLPPISLAIGIVTAAAHRENVREILRHAMRGWVVLMTGIFLFAFGISFLFEWLLPG